MAAAAAACTGGVKADDIISSLLSHEPPTISAHALAADEQQPDAARQLRQRVKA
jgi:hypothetical protein